MLQPTPGQRKLWWNLVMVAAVAGIICGSIEMIEYWGVWKALMAIPLMGVLGYLAVEVLYPLWFKE